MELVSIAVVIYNSERTIVETLNSIKNQTYERLELVVSDDCSTDETINIVREWCANNSRRFENIEIIENEKNLGVALNGNLAYSKCHGKYFQSIAGDDRLPKMAIEKKVSFAEINNLPVVLSKVKLFGKNETRVHVMELIFEENYHTLLKLNKKERLIKSTQGNCLCSPIVGFWKKEYFERMGGYDSRFPMLEDWYMSIKLFKQGIYLPLLEEVGYEYRVSSGSLSGSFSKPKLQCDIKKMRWEVCIPILLRYGLYKDALKMAIENM